MRLNTDGEVAQTGDMLGALVARSFNPELSVVSQAP